MREKQRTGGTLNQQIGEVDHNPPPLVHTVNHPQSSIARGVEPNAPLLEQFTWYWEIPPDGNHRQSKNVVGLFSGIPGDFPGNRTLSSPVLYRVCVYLAANKPTRARICPQQSFTLADWDNVAERKTPKMRSIGSGQLDSASSIIDRTKWTAKNSCCCIKMRAIWDWNLVGFNLRCMWKLPHMVSVRFAVGLLHNSNAGWCTMYAIDIGVHWKGTI